MEFSIYEWCIVFIALYAVLCYFIPSFKVSKKVFVLLSSGHLLAIQGLRAISVGGDLIRYENNYNLVKNSSVSGVFSGGSEIGYSFVEFIFGQFGLPFQALLFVISFFNIYVLGRTIYKYSTYPSISYLLYLAVGIYDFGFSGLRQSIAMSIILISFKYINEQKKWKFLLVIIIASLFHNTSLLFLFVYFLTNKTFKKIYQKIFPLVLLIILIFGKQLSYYATLVFNEELIDYYNSSVSSIGTTAAILFVILLIGILFEYKIKKLKDNKIYSDLLVIISIAFIIQLLSPYSYLFTRVNMYFFQFIILFVPLIYDIFIKRVASKNTLGKFTIRSTINIIFFIAILLYYHSYLESNPHWVLPHYFFWTV